MMIEQLPAESPLRNMQNRPLAIRCPKCDSFYPNQVPKIKPGKSIVLCCKPSRRQWGLKRPAVPKGEKAKWCGAKFVVRVTKGEMSPADMLRAQAIYAQNGAL